MFKYIIRRKATTFSYFKGPNSTVNVFQLIKKRKFWFGKVILESTDLELVRMAGQHTSNCIDLTLNQRSKHSARPVKVN